MWADLHFPLGKKSVIFQQFVELLRMIKALLKQLLSSFIPRAWCTSTEKKSSHRQLGVWRTRILNFLLKSTTQFLNVCCVLLATCFLVLGCSMLAVWCLMPACCLLLGPWTPARHIYRGPKGGAADGPLSLRMGLASAQASNRKQQASSKVRACCIKNMLRFPDGIFAIRPRDESRTLPKLKALVFMPAADFSLSATRSCLAAPIDSDPY